MSNYAVSTQNLIKKYHDRTVVKDFNFEIQPGVVHALAGPPSSGKTTILNILAGTVMPSGGPQDIQLPPGQCGGQKNHRLCAG
jgi:ABC-type multidrug transport system ATPase subunit